MHGRRVLARLDIVIPNMSQTDVTDPSADTDEVSRPLRTRRRALGQKSEMSSSKGLSAGTGTRHGIGHVTKGENPVSSSLWRRSSVVCGEEMGEGLRLPGSERPGRPTVGILWMLVVPVGCTNYHGWFRPVLTLSPSPSESSCTPSSRHLTRRAPRVRGPMVARCRATARLMGTSVWDVWRIAVMHGRRVLGRLDIVVRLGWTSLIPPPTPTK